jgi:glycosyltransferase involved in cell wall biosynthesis
MHVCLITANIIKNDGQGRVNYEIAQQLLARGHRLTVITNQLMPELQNHANVRWQKIKVDDWPTGLLKGIVSSLQVDRWLSQASPCDLVVANGAVTNVPVDVNLVHFVHTAWLQSPAYGAKQAKSLYDLYQLSYTFFNSSWERKAFLKAQHLVAVSEFVKQQLEILDLPSDKSVHIITNGVDTDEFFPISVDASQPAHPSQAPKALFVGDIRSKRKNLDTVLHALKMVPNLQLDVVGDACQSPFPQLSQDLNVHERVRFLGFRRDVKDLMREADFFVFPSRYDPFGLVVLEAMASGLPIITAKTTGASELVTPDCGIVLDDPEDCISLAAALKELSQNAELRSRMRKASRKIAEHYRWQSVGSKYADLFERLVEQKVKKAENSYEVKVTNPDQSVLLRNII